MLRFLDILQQSLARGETLAIATVIKNETIFDAPLATRIVIYPDGRLEGSLGSADLDRRVAADAILLLGRRRSRTRAYELEPEKYIEIYIEVIAPPTPFVIIGADPDSAPIVEFGVRAGFRVILVDHREMFADLEKYPLASETIVTVPDELSEKVSLSEQTFVLVKTHNYLRDKEILKTVLPSLACYVGQLGPKARTEDLLADLAKENIHFTDVQLQRLYAPAGLDLGAETPEQIAISIVAEMLAIQQNRAGGFLKDQTAAIHPRD